MTLVRAAKQLGSDQVSQTTQDALDDAIIREQGCIIDEYWEALRPFYAGITQ